MSHASEESRPLSVEVLSKRFVKFAERECGAEPVYDALCRAAAQDTDTLRLLWHAPVEQQRPNLLLAAVHDLLLLGTPHPLRDYYPSVGGERRVDAQLAACFAHFRDEHRMALIERIARRTTQTNEIGRCAVLWPALRHIACAHAAGRPLALIDFGCSAGLNLGVDSYRYDYGQFTLGAPESASTPEIACRLIGPRSPFSTAAAEPRLSVRLGLDIAPADVHDAEAMRWLRACLWPHDLERARRFDQAVALAQQYRWPVERASDCVAALQRFVHTLPATVLPVVLNSWVLSYFDAQARARYVNAVEELVRQRGGAWLSAEAPALKIGQGQPPVPTLEGAEYAAGSLWTLCTAQARGLTYEWIARSHPHGKWLEWLASAPKPAM